MKHYFLGMKNSNFKYFLILFYGLQIFAAHKNEFILLTWNVLGMNAQDRQEFFDDRQNAQRPQAILRELQSANGDVICLQEVSPQDSSSGGILDLAKINPKYARAAYARKGTHGGCVVFYNNNKFDCEWFHGLGMMDNRPVSKDHKLGGGAAACALLRDKRTKQSCMVCSVHLSRGNLRGRQDDFNPNLQVSNEEKGRFQLESLMNQLRDILKSRNMDLNNYPLILAGDFNTLYEEVLNDYCPMLHMNMFEHQLFTVSKNNHTFASIDHILYRPANFLNVAESNKFLDPTMTSHDYQSPLVPKLKNFHKNNDLEIISDMAPSDHLGLGAVFSFDQLAPGAKITPVRPTPKNPVMEPKAVTPHERELRSMLQNLYAQEYDRLLMHLIQNGIYDLDQILLQIFDEETKDLIMGSQHQLAQELREAFWAKAWPHIQQAQAQVHAKAQAKLAKAQPVPVRPVAKGDLGARLARAVRVARVLSLAQ